jgi:hypothetical protein
MSSKRPSEPESYAVGWIDMILEITAKRDVGRGRLAATFNWFWPLEVVKSETGSGISESQGPWSFLLESLSKISKELYLAEAQIGVQGSRTLMSVEKVVKILRMQ